MKIQFVLGLAASLCAYSAFAEGVGYEDTPIIPGQKWKVHDKARPNPPVVTPAATFSHNAPAPSDATILFDGTDLKAWKSAGKNDAAKWKVENGYFEVVKGTGDIETKEQFGDYQLHIEWAAPKEIRGESQGRGNSGIFMHGRHEVQVLDVYNNKTYADGQAGALYGMWAPLQNAMKPPGEFNSYDIIFEAAKWDPAGNLIKQASVTVIQNGVVLHHRQNYNGPTGHRNVPVNTPYNGRGGIRLQDHGDAVRFRNIWIRPLGEYDRPEKR